MNAFKPEKIHRIILKISGEYLSGQLGFGFDNLITRLLQKGEIVRAHPHKGMWLDIGRESDYRQANELMAQAYREGKNAII